MLRRFDHARRSVMWRIILNEGAYEAHADGLCHIRRNATEDVDPTVLPFGHLEAVRGQGSQCGPVQALEQLAAGGAEVSHRAAVEIAELLPDRLVHLGEGEEGSVAEHGEDPPLGDLNADLDLGLV